MKQAIAGVAPAQSGEVTVMTVWPSISMFALGRVLGQLFANKTGFYVFTVGNLFALLSIPIALKLYFMRVGPFIGVRYRVTNKRILVLRGLQGKVEDKSRALDQFDEIEIEVLPGQAWYDSGNLVFRLDGTECFRLDGVSRPRAFREVCWKAHKSYVGVQQALAVA